MECPQCGGELCELLNPTRNYLGYPHYACTECEWESMYE